MPELALTEPPAECIPDRSRLTRDEDAIICELHKLGKTQPEIAQAVGCHQSTVSRVLATFVDRRPHATRILHANADKMAQDIVDGRDLRVKLQVLENTGVAPRQAPEGASKAGLTVLIGASDSQVQVNIITPEI